MYCEDKVVMFERGDWYQYFCDKLNTSFEEFDQNKISIITFNYDRSLEHSLFTALKNSYGKNDRDCALKLKISLLCMCMDSWVIYLGKTISRDLFAVYLNSGS